MTLVFSQAAPFTGAAYQYLRADDALPGYREIAEEPDPLCRVKLFQPFSRWTFYAVAATEYEGLADIAAVRVPGLPPERDLHFEPTRLSEVEAYIARHGYGP
jgi:hypothetical protein